MARNHSPEVAARVAQIKSLICTGSTPKWCIEWCQTEQAGDPTANIPAKTWKVSRQTARKYVEIALEELGDFEAVAQDRKRARNRGLHFLILNRLLEKNTVSALAAAVKIADQLCKIDGSYDPTSLGPMAGLPEPADDEEAAAMIEHAAATLELARSRGKHLPQRAQVIDVEASEDEPAVVPERPTDAN